ncbi:MAG: hypothetical protein ACXVYY_00995 [Oryzihumus sp.]
MKRPELRQGLRWGLSISPVHERVDGRCAACDMEWPCAWKVWPA